MSERLEKGTFVIGAICPGVPASEMPELPRAGQYMHGIECPGGIVGKSRADVQPAQPAPSLSEIARKIEEIRKKVEALRAAVKRRRSDEG